MSKNGGENKFVVGDLVKHRFRENKYQNCTVVAIEYGSNGRIIVVCEDGFYGGIDQASFAQQDLTKI